MATLTAQSGRSDSLATTSSPLVHRDPVATLTAQSGRSDMNRHSAVRLRIRRCGHLDGSERSFRPGLQLPKDGTGRGGHLDGSERSFRLQAAADGLELLVATLTAQSGRSDTRRDRGCAAGRSGRGHLDGSERSFRLLLLWPLLDQRK